MSVMARSGEVNLSDVEQSDSAVCKRKRSGEVQLGVVCAEAEWSRAVPSEVNCSVAE